MVDIRSLTVNRDGKNNKIMVLFRFSWINSTVLVQRAEENPKLGTNSIKLISDINITTSITLWNDFVYTKECSKIPTLSLPAILISVNTITVVMPRAPHSHHMALVIAHSRISDGIWPGCMMTDLSPAFPLGPTG